MTSCGVRVFALLGLGFGVGVGLLACGTSDMSFYTCDAPELGHKALDGTPDPCRRKEKCPPEACTLFPPEWTEPVWLWVGAKEQLPDCPGGPGNEAYNGRADPVYGPKYCAPCTCKPSTGLCALPSSITASSSTCALDGPGSAHIKLDAPAAWDGSCDKTNPLPAGVAASLTIAEPKVLDEGCQPDFAVPAVMGNPMPPMPGDGPSWSTYARACHGLGWSLCEGQHAGDDAAVCIPKEAPPPPDFRLCIYHQGETTCSTLPVPWKDAERFVFYDAEPPSDTRACSRCDCGPPVGSLCTASVSLYTDSDCKTAPYKVETVTSKDYPPLCADLEPAGMALSSKSAAPPAYVPGSCAPSGGALEGGVSGNNPFTFCCMR